MNSKPKTTKQWLDNQRDHNTLSQYAQFAAQLRDWQLLFARSLPANLAAQCELLNVRDGQLIVRTRSASAASQLRSLTTPLINAFGHAGIKLNQVTIDIDPAQKVSSNTSQGSAVSRRQRLLNLAEQSSEPLKTQLLKLADQIANSNKLTPDE
ncbi:MULTISPECIES: DciA family protein [unclassified Idiomarina]|jgi:hypothetical protein|uniref:DciA family protein n=1 Tax=unclassified Idiomarina TaxID=2614829 RepID=UPI000C904FAC|nr:MULTISPECIES: DciA family protein [unclassified Idiomarina]MAD52601.1 hypothetical protein [Idiomarinaceae bacterium]MEC7643296.1 DciA family protein [Pseudomonadota bacterium]NQZ03325.1 DUF721 domain-containing protein [Idiomarina sp.]|tara:strand:+ start:7525 stop:7983 length:459 start_codon:yes stop_codon:yes gene_type:complete